jgi:single-strand DNA-binding protein
MQMNRVVIAGCVSKAADVRHLPSGTPVAHVRVGETVRYADDSGGKKELTNWHSLSFYGKLADVAQALKKGDNIYVDSDRAAAIHRTRRQQAANSARDRSDPVSRDRTRPKREQSGGIGHWKKRCQWIKSMSAGAGVENDQ